VSTIFYQLLYAARYTGNELITSLGVLGLQALHPSVVLVDQEWKMASKKSRFLGFFKNLKPQKSEI